MPIQTSGLSLSISSSCSDRRRGGAGAGQSARRCPHASAARAIIWPTGWMPSGNEQCARLPRAHAPAQWIDARKAHHRRLDVAVAARIEKGRAGGAARAPVFGRCRRVAGRQAEVSIELACPTCCAACPCRASGSCATRRDHRAGRGVCDRACPGRTGARLACATAWRLRSD